jgi:hypothetical protein
MLQNQLLKIERHHLQTVQLLIAVETFHSLVPHLVVKGVSLDKELVFLYGCKASFYIYV